MSRRSSPDPGLTRRPLRLALTCDDAPTVFANENSFDADATRMDTIRDALREFDIPHCVAFVIGRVAKGEESRLKAWLDAGYELANHTFDHEAASEIGAEAFLESAARCNEVLESVGAFRDNPRYFRHPYLDCGKPEDRPRIRDGIREAGYTCAPASVDFFDHAFEQPLAQALSTGSQKRIDKVEARYLNVALSSLAHISARSRAMENIIQVPFFHFGGITSRTIRRLLERLTALPVEWCNLREALTHEWYRGYNDDPASTGLLGSSVLSQSLGSRVQRRLMRLSRRSGMFDQARSGPKWPYL